MATLGLDEIQSAKAEEIHVRRTIAGFAVGGITAKEN
jgi:hypothetical protein